MTLVANLPPIRVSADGSDKLDCCTDCSTDGVTMAQYLRSGANITEKAGRFELH